MRCLWFKALASQAILSAGFAPLSANDDLPSSFPPSSPLQAALRALDTLTKNDITEVSSGEGSVAC